MKNTTKKISKGEYEYRGYRIVLLPPNGYNSIRLWEIYEPNVNHNWTYGYTLKEAKTTINDRLTREEK